MVLEQEVCDERQIVSTCRQMLGKSLFLAGTRFRNVEIGNMPIFDHQPKCAGRLEFFELPQALNRQNIRGIKFGILTCQILILFGKILLVRNRVALPLGEIEKAERCSVSPPFVTKYLSLPKAIFRT